MYCIVVDWLVVTLLETYQTGKQRSAWLYTGSNITCHFFFAVSLIYYKAADILYCWLLPCTAKTRPLFIPLGIFYVLVSTRKSNQHPWHEWNSASLRLWSRLQCYIYFYVLFFFTAVHIDCLTVGQLALHFQCFYAQHVQSLATKATQICLTMLQFAG